jgi:hypothetical protein
VVSLPLGWAEGWDLVKNPISESARGERAGTVCNTVGFGLSRCKSCLFDATPGRPGA